MHEAVVIGVSAGGMEALGVLLPALQADFPLPLIIVQHIGAQPGNVFLTEHFGEISVLTVKEVEDKERIEVGTVYLAPPNYHLLIERDRTFSLSIDEKVNFSRPSIDVLFESAADAYGQALIGVVLTGASIDGAQGLKAIKERGGLTIVQDPASAEYPYMPQAALRAADPDHVIPIDRIAPLLRKYGRKGADAEYSHR